MMNTEWCAGGHLFYLQKCMPKQVKVSALQPIVAAKIQLMTVSWNICPGNVMQSPFLQGGLIAIFSHFPISPYLTASTTYCHANCF
jgi:hypothetical protein